MADRSDAAWSVPTNMPVPNGVFGAGGHGPAKMVLKL